MSPRAHVIDVILGETYVINAYVNTVSTIYNTLYTKGTNLQCAQAVNEPVLSCYKPQIHLVSQSRPLLRCSCTPAHMSAPLSSQSAILGDHTRPYRLVLASNSARTLVQVQHCLRRPRQAIHCTQYLRLGSYICSARLNLQHCTVPGSFAACIALTTSQRPGTQPLYAY